MLGTQAVFFGCVMLAMGLATIGEGVMEIQSAERATFSSAYADGRYHPCMRMDIIIHVCGWMLSSVYGDGQYHSYMWMDIIIRVCGWTSFLCVDKHYHPYVRMDLRIHIANTDVQLCIIIRICGWRSSSVCAYGNRCWLPVTRCRRLQIRAKNVQHRTKMACRAWWYESW